MSEEKTHLEHLHFVAKRKCPFASLIDNDKKVIGKALGILDVLSEIFDIKVCIIKDTRYLHLTQKSTGDEYYTCITEEQYNKILKGI